MQSQGTSSDMSRDAKSNPYKNTRYETLLLAAGVHMDKPPLHVRDSCKDLSQKIFDTEQATPVNTLFRDDLFEDTCAKVRNENEARVIKDITWLIVASAETLATYGATKLDILIEKVNSSWLKCIPLTKPRPQPDYSVGFRATAFTQDQLRKLGPFVGDSKDQCSIMAREDMYFPFFTGEVKCGDQALNVADRQNMHSASVAVKGLVELFRKVNREEEVDRTILAFSISHDNENVRIYGHYALIDSGNVSIRCYRYPLHKFNITARGGKEKWTAYKFTKSVYDIFVPSHLNRIRAAIDQLPDPEVFLVGPLSQMSKVDDEDIEQSGSRSTLSCSQESTPRPSSSRTSSSAFKKPKGKCSQ